MADIDTASAELEQALVLLQTAVQAGAAPSPASQSVDALGLSTATTHLLQRGNDLAASMERLQVALQSITASLQADDIAETLQQRVGTFAEKAEAAAREKSDAFESMAEELRTAATGEIQQWLEEGAEEIAEELMEAGEQVGATAEQALQRLAEALKTAVEKVGDRVAESVKDRSADALNSVVEAAVGRALNETAETLITTQMGTTITSAIGPYLPAVIALQRSVGAIQSALDAMRAGT